MQHVLFEDDSRLDLLPLTFTRPVAELRVGIVTIREKWAHHLKSSPALLTQPHLSGRYGSTLRPDDTLFINGKVLPDPTLAHEILHHLHPGEAWTGPADELIAFRTTPAILGIHEGMILREAIEAAGLRIIPCALSYDAIRFPWDIFRQNKAQIIADWPIVTAKAPSQFISDPHTAVYGRDNIYLAPGVKIRAAILNAEDGPIYLGESVDVQEGAIIHGAHAILPHATLNMGAKMRGDTTVGPWSKVGGEVANSVIQGYANKGHEGYLGNSVIGQWCNLGADTNTSNLKNNYAEVRVWNYRKRSFIRTGQLFCGLIMGDHSKCGINTMWNTGTVVGVSANVFGDGYPRNFVPSFAWGGAAGFTTFGLKKAYEVAEAVMGRRGISLDQDERHILQHVFEQTAEFRTWEREAANTSNITES